MYYSKFSLVTAEGLQEGSVDTFKAGQAAVAVQAQQFAVGREVDNMVDEGGAKGGPASPLSADCISDLSEEGSTNEAASVPVPRTGGGGEVAGAPAVRSLGVTPAKRLRLCFDV
jgi:hypothetical protein